MEGRDSRRRYRTAAEALEQLFAMPSDDESVDGMEDSDDDTSSNNVNETTADDVSDSGETDDDDDILYQLADPNTDIDIDLSMKTLVTRILSHVALQQTMKKLSGIKMHLWRAILILII